MRGWLSLARNISQPYPPPPSLIASRKRDPEIVSLPRALPLEKKTTAEARGGSLRP